MENITLIIGAGASKDLNPKEIGSGAELVKEIANRVTDRTSPLKPNLSNILLNKHGQKISKDFSTSQLSHFVACLDSYSHTVSNPSIDEFLNEVETFPEYEKHRETFLFIGYFAIIFHILGYEGHASKVLLDSNKWLFTLKKFIEENKIFESNNKENFNIITFNYDRIIEEFLHKHFGNSCLNFCTENIVHVYKKIGRLEWQKEIETEEGLLPFGLKNDQPNDYENYIKYIELMYTKRKNLCEVEKSKKILNKSNSVYCFGYGFDDINNKLLGLESLKRIGKNLKVNVYPGEDPLFTYRCQLTKIIKGISDDADIHYQTCSDFLKDCLFPSSNS